MSRYYEKVQISNNNTRKLVRFAKIENKDSVFIVNFGKFSHVTDPPYDSSGGKFYPFHA